MIYRHMTHSRLRVGVEEQFCLLLKRYEQEFRASLEASGIVDWSVFRDRSGLFCYFESDTRWEGVLWPEEAEAYLEQWPDQEGKETFRSSVKLLDIYHSAVPVDRSTWRDGRAVEKRIGSVARIHEEKYASYVYYHYQRQEEMPGAENKTYMIGSLGRLLFSYQELPASREDEPRRGELATRNTPANWGEVMYPHFEQWPDAAEGEAIWRKIERLI